MLRRVIHALDASARRTCRMTGLPESEKSTEELLQEIERLITRFEMERVLHNEMQPLQPNCSEKVFHSGIRRGGC